MVRKTTRRTHDHTAMRSKTGLSQPAVVWITSAKNLFSYYQVRMERNVLCLLVGVLPLGKRKHVNSLYSKSEDFFASSALGVVQSRGVHLLQDSEFLVQSSHLPGVRLRAPVCEAFCLHPVSRSVQQEQKQSYSA